MKENYQQISYVGKLTLWQRFTRSSVHNRRNFQSFPYALTQQLRHIINRLLHRINLLAGRLQLCCSEMPNWAKIPWNSFFFDYIIEYMSSPLKNTLLIRLKMNKDSLWNLLTVIDKMKPFSAEIIPNIQACMNGSLLREQGISAIFIIKDVSSCLLKVFDQEKSRISMLGWITNRIEPFEEYLKKNKAESACNQCELVGNWFKNRT